MTTMNFTNENMDINMSETIIKILYDSVIDGNQINITENHFVTLRGIIDNIEDFVVIIEQTYINEIDIEPDEFDLNNHDIFQDFINYLSSLFIIKFYFRDELYLGLNDIFMRNTVRKNNNLHELMKTNIFPVIIFV